MASTIESIINDSKLLSKSFNDLLISVDILKQIDLNLSLSDYKGAIYSKEEGDKIINFYSQKYGNNKTLKTIHRVRSRWDSSYEKIRKEIYSKLVRK